MTTDPELEDDPEYQDLLAQARASVSGHDDSARGLALKVWTLGGYVVWFAYAVAISGVFGGIVFAVVGLGASSPGEGLLFGLLTVVVSLAQATFIALIGRYAQMRASLVHDGLEP